MAMSLMTAREHIRSVVRGEFNEYTPQIFALDMAMLSTQCGPVALRAMRRCRRCGGKVGENVYVRIIIFQFTRSAICFEEITRRT